MKSKNKNYYIKLAGNYSEKADKTNVYIVEKYGDYIKSVENESIKPGDIIVVPISQEHKFLTSIVIPIIEATATTIGVIIAIYATLHH